MKVPVNIKLSPNRFVMAVMARSVIAKAHSPITKDLLNPTPIIKAPAYATHLTVRPSHVGGLRVNTGVSRDLNALSKPDIALESRLGKTPRKSRAGVKVIILFCVFICRGKY